jgi:hypothetical protein
MKAYAQLVKIKLQDDSVPCQLLWQNGASGWAVSAAMFTPTNSSCGTLQRFLPPPGLFATEEMKTAT